MRPGVFVAGAMPGRELNSVSPYRSFPVVMSKGGPVLAVMNGLNRMPHLGVTVPPRNTRWCTSVAAGPYSRAMLCGFAGNVPRPSVLLMAWLYMYEPLSEMSRVTRVFILTIN